MSIELTESVSPAMANDDLKGKYSAAPTGVFGDWEQYFSQTKDWQIVNDVERLTLDQKIRLHEMRCPQGNPFLVHYMSKSRVANYTFDTLKALELPDTNIYAMTRLPDGSPNTGLPYLRVFYPGHHKISDHHWPIAEHIFNTLDNVDLVINSNGLTLLQVAVCFGDLRAIKHLLSLGANLEHVTLNQTTCDTMAAKDDIRHPDGFYLEYLAITLPHRMKGQASSCRPPKAL